MMKTVDATPTALDQPVRLDLPSAPALPPPTPDQPMLTHLPPPPAGLEPSPIPSPVLSGPSTVFSADAAIVPPEYTAPVLPSLAPAAPAPSPSAADGAGTAGTAFDVHEFLSTPGPGRKAPTKKRGRWFVRLLLVGLLGAGGWAAQHYGPALYDEHVRGAEATATTESSAPLAFPNVAAAPAPIRTAEFVLVGLPETPGVTYHVITDFETDVSQVDITRTDAPDLQILTYADDAMIRRADSDQWYLLARGQFPLDGRLDRTDWVRRIDELLPTGLRDRAVIDASTEALISGVPTRHLSLTVHPSLLDAMSVEDVPAPTTSPDGLASPIAEPLDLASAATPAGAVNPPAAASDVIAIEIWVDGDGLVRQVTGAPQLGAQTITIVRTSAEAWIPEYPAPDAISELTASALVELGV